jgi:hypothetical protein
MYQVPPGHKSFNASFRFRSQPWSERLAAHASAPEVSCKSHIKVLIQDNVYFIFAVFDRVLSRLWQASSLNSADFSHFDNSTTAAVTIDIHGSAYIPPHGFTVCCASHVHISSHWQLLQGRRPGLLPDLHGRRTGG